MRNERVVPRATRPKQGRNPTVRRCGDGAGAIKFPATCATQSPIDLTSPTFAACKDKVLFLKKRARSFAACKDKERAGILRRFCGIQPASPPMIHAKKQIPVEFVPSKTNGSIKVSRRLAPSRVRWKARKGSLLRYGGVRQLADRVCVCTAKQSSLVVWWASGYPLPARSCTHVYRHRPPILGRILAGRPVQVLCTVPERCHMQYVPDRSRGSSIWHVLFTGRQV